MAQAKRRGGLKRVIEERLEGPVFFVVLPLMVASAAQTFSGGVFNLPRLLGPLFPAWQVGRGLGLGFGSETLTVIAGRSWRAWLREASEIKTRPGLSKLQRRILSAEAEAHARRSFIFMIVGVGASLFAGGSYYLSSARTMTPADLVNDLVATAVISAVVLYLGVFRDSKSDDATEEMLSGIQSGMNQAVDGAILRFKDGIASDVDISLIAENLPAQMQAKFRRAVAKRVDGEMWTTAMLRAALNYGNDSTQARRLNSQVRKLAEKSELGLQRGPDGKSWLIPRAVVMDVWGESIGEAKALARMLNGRSSVTAPEMPSPAPDVIRMFPGRDPGMSESVAG